MKEIIKFITDTAHLVCLSLDLAFETRLEIATVQYTETIFYINSN